jgi:ABC-2 type transport system ATP-binding protein
MEPEIEARDIRKLYGSLTALNGVSLEVQPGIFFGLLGPNGAGKTTLVSILTTLLHPTAGSAFVGGFDVVRQGAGVRSLIGVVPQENNLDRYLTARENLIFHAKMHGMKASQYHRRIDELLSIMGLGERQKDYPTTFSTGMQRRLVIARALVHDPRVLFLDEPTTGLDPQAKWAIWEYFLALKGKRTLFVTTHNMEEADLLCDRINIIDNGSIIAAGTAAELKETVEENAYYEIEVAGGTEEYAASLKELSFIENVSAQNGVLVVTLKRGGSLGGLVERIHLRDLKRITSRQPSLEDVFLKLTGRNLRT